MSDNPQATAYKFLQDRDLAVLSTVRTDGTPTGAAIYYVIDEDFNMYFVTKSNTLKFSNIKVNGKVAITVFDEPERTTVQGEGEASEVKNDEAEPKIMNMLAKVRTDKSHAWFPPVALLEGGEYTLIKIHFNKIKYVNYKSYKPGEELVHDIKV